MKEDKGKDKKKKNDIPVVLISKLEDGVYAAEYATAYDNSDFVVTPIVETIKEMIANAELYSISRKRYQEVPNWSMLQADTVGYIRALTEVLKLLPKGKGEI